MATKRIISWDNITDGCTVLAENISKKQTYDIIIGIGRGGLIPASILANYLNIPRVLNFGCRSYTEDNHKGGLEVYQDIDLVNGAKYLSNSHVLIVDDLSDTGDTFAGTMLSIAERFPNRSMASATLYVKPEAKYIPDFYYKKLSASPWLVFPWEMKGVNVTDVL